jgi:hypothetical protein
MRKSRGQGQWRSLTQVHGFSRHVQKPGRRVATAYDADSLLHALYPQLLHLLVIWPLGPHTPLV